MYIKKKIAADVIFPRRHIFYVVIHSRYLILIIRMLSYCIGNRIFVVK